MKNIFDFYGRDIFNPSCDGPMVHTSIPLSEEEQKVLVGTFIKIADENSYEKRNEIWNDEFKPFVEKKLKER